MFTILCIFASIWTILNGKRIIVGPDVACDSEDETKVYYRELELFCQNSRCNLNFENYPQICVPDTTCFGFFECNGNDYVASDGSMMTCEKSTICNKNFAWPCKPCLIEACVENTFTCDNSNDKMVHILKPVTATMLCPGDTVCNKNKVYPCDWCIPKESGSITTTTTLRPEPNCNDGKGHTNPCRMGNDGNKSVYYRCKAVWNWYEYEILPCSNLRKDSICRNKVWWC